MRAANHANLQDERITSFKDHRYTKGKMIDTERGCEGNLYLQL